ncbi:MAG: Holliday junction resolvase RuvX [Rickettsiales bacterium]
MSNTRLLGFDLGEVRIGVALSDTSRTIASPLMMLPRKKKFSDVASAIAELIKKHQVGGIVIGLPLNMDGSEGPRVQSVRAFANNLSKHIDIPIHFWDERMSTMAVARTLEESGISHTSRKEQVDKMAASYILQGYLDKQHHA